jgi:hypothetical protein
MARYNVLVNFVSMGMKTFIIFNFTWKACMVVLKYLSSSCIYDYKQSHGGSNLNSPLFF